MNIEERLKMAGFAQHVKNVCMSKHTFRVDCDGRDLTAYSGDHSVTIHPFDFKKYREGSKELRNPGMKTSMQRYLAWSALNKRRA